MTIPRTLFVIAVAALAAGPLLAQAPAPAQPVTMTEETAVGMWVTADGHVRHELLPGGRYDEARGSRKSAYQGRWRLTGNRIDYVDDTGFPADGEFIDGVLHHGGMVLRRERR
ncbi:hypothetical protein STVA_35620 [Allostella vacuolata]|nr:hypothetical protein STVA_35620 [Stella vacuolata]